MLVSMLVRFFLLRFRPSTPCPGEFRALGLERAESDERFSVRKERTGQRSERASRTYTYINTADAHSSGEHTQVSPLRGDGSHGAAALAGVSEDSGCPGPAAFALFPRDTHLLFLP